MSGKLEGQVAFVTGAGRGQGRNHAIRMAEEGADIIALDICRNVDSVFYDMSTPEDLEETVRLVEKAGRRMFARQADVRDEEAVAAVVDAGVAEFGRLDIVLANAGINTYAGTDTMTAPIWNEMIDINLTGVWNTCKAAIPHVIAGGRGGKIVLTSSMCGLKGWPNIAHYTAAKHGVVGLMRSLAQELAPHSIRVNTVNPTGVNTDMIQNEESWKLFCPDVENPTREDFRPVAQDMNALPVPWIEIDDVTNAIMFLISDDARYITGTTLQIDAGALL
ncbi:MAG: 3-ketoacyl-ACP reductase [Pseudonocardia sp. SCN 72-86]|nr:MAG: 3-ketoacyl-ACP reductase [Pseudonocardia sp. SCN 72-86]